MALRRLAIHGLLAACACLAVAWAAASDAAIVRYQGPSIVRYGGLELRADGDFRPHELPRNHPAPIEFEGRASVRATDGGPLPPLDRVVLDFDRDGRLLTKGLPTCAPASVESAGVAAARRRCAKAIVGKGRVGALVLIEGVWLRVTGELTLFNGPAQGGTATVIAHAQPISLPDEIYVVTIPIERIRGEYRYRATVDVPDIFNGTGVLTNIEAKIGRRYRADGRKRSYVSARCSDGTLGVHGILTFGDGTVIDGSVEKHCLPEGLLGP
jgi:hypothetical protein